MKEYLNMFRTNLVEAVLLRLTSSSEDGVVAGTDEWRMEVAVECQTQHMTTECRKAVQKKYMRITLANEGH
jgi:hypothetical protein